MSNANTDTLFGKCEQQQNKNKDTTENEDKSKITY